MSAKVFFIVIDGLGDRPCTLLKGKTPLEAARRRFLDIMAAKGSCGVHYPIAPGLPVGSAIAHLCLFGYGVEDYPGRGPLEAIGAGIEISEKDLVYRINFATVREDFTVIDRRAGRDEYGLDELCVDLNEEFSKNPFGFEIEVRRIAGHRGVLIIKDENVDPVPDTDPQEPGKKIRLPKGDSIGAKVIRWITERAYEVLNSNEINEIRKRKGMLPANMILIRGGGRLKKVEKFSERYHIRAFGVADKPLYLGVAKYLGFDVECKSDPEKISAVLKNLDKYDFFFVHYKYADTYAEDGRPDLKAKYIENVDSRIGRLYLEIGEEDAVYVVTGDHCTSSEYKRHIGDPVPFLITGKGVPSDNVKKFTEKECRKGYFGIVPAKSVLYHALDFADLIETFLK